MNFVLGLSLAKVAIVGACQVHLPVSAEVHFAP